MLTRLTIRNFKRFDEVEIELGSPVVFIGPNNSGKTSAMQALALWDIGLKRWTEQRSRDRLLPPPGLGAGRLLTPIDSWRATINRRDLVAIPVPQARLLWRELRISRSRSIGVASMVHSIHIDLTVEGVNRGRTLDLRAGIRTRERGVRLLPTTPSSEFPESRTGTARPHHSSG